MRKLRSIDKMKWVEVGDDGGAGYFFHQRVRLGIVVSFGDGWDHVSVSLHNRLPSWDEMNAVKDAFFTPDEVVVQFHPAKSQYVNCHPYCLHLWRPQNQEMPQPPAWMVGLVQGEHHA